MHMFYCAMKGI